MSRHLFPLRAILCFRGQEKKKQIEDTHKACTVHRLYSCLVQSLSPLLSRENTSVQLHWTPYIQNLTTEKKKNYASLENSRHKMCRKGLMHLYGIPKYKIELQYRRVHEAFLYIIMYIIHSQFAIQKKSKWDIDDVSNCCGWHWQAQKQIQDGETDLSFLFLDFRSTRHQKLHVRIQPKTKYPTHWHLYTHLPPP